MFILLFIIGFYSKENDLFIISQSKSNLVLSLSSPVDHSFLILLDHRYTPRDRSKKSKLNLMSNYCCFSLQILLKRKPNIGIHSSWSIENNYRQTNTHISLPISSRKKTTCRCPMSSTTKKQFLSISNIIR